METISKKSIEIIKDAITKIAEVNGKSENLLIQVVDQSLFEKDKPIRDILYEINDKIENEYHTRDMTIHYDKDGRSVIAIGYTFPLKEGGMK